MPPSSPARRPRVATARPRPAERGRFEAAYQALKTDIVEGRYSPNQHLVEAELTQALAVSRALVRQILVRLQEEGLVAIAPHRGARVRAFTREEAVEVLHVREALEVLAASLAATRASEAELAAMAEIVSAMGQAITAGDLPRYSAINGRFHRAICQAAHHPTLERALGSLHFPLIRYQFRTVLAPARKEASLAEHREILAALLRRDARAAGRAMGRHLAKVRAVVAGLVDVPQY